VVLETVREYCAADDASRAGEYDFHGDSLMRDGLYGKVIDVKLENEELYSKIINHSTTLEDIFFKICITLSS
jgi:hypothetical protein